MNDAILTLSNPETVAVTVNAILLISMTLAMGFAKRLECLGLGVSAKIQAITSLHSDAQRLFFIRLRARF